MSSRGQWRRRGAQSPPIRHRLPQDSDRGFEFESAWGEIPRADEVDRRSSNGRGAEFCATACSSNRLRLHRRPIGLTIGDLNAFTYDLFSCDRSRWWTDGSCGGGGPSYPTSALSDCRIGNHVRMGLLLREYETLFIFLCRLWLCKWRNISANLPGDDAPRQ